MLKDTKLYSILNNKCPKCHQGDFFIDKHAYNLKTFIKMHEKCSHCGELFNKEVGFYYGAMYVSYGLNIAYGMGLFLLMVLILKLNVMVFLFSFLGLVIVLFPVTMRISRLMYINLFVKFDKTIK
jgi:uncharacterized protein (DUF983 family)